MRKAIFPGTFDPFTLGHLDILKRSLSLFDEIIVGVGVNENKNTMFNSKQRVDFIKKCLKNEPKVKVLSYSGLTIDFCKKVGANFIVEVFAIMVILNLKKQLQGPIENYQKLKLYFC